MTSRHSEQFLRATLARYYDAEAGRLLEVSRERARQMRLEMGVPRPPDRRSVTRKRVVELLRQGVAPKVVARAVGHDPSWVRKIGRAAGWKPRPAALAPCGTRAAYERHRRRGEAVDVECNAANNARRRERRRGGAR